MQPPVRGRRAPFSSIRHALWSAAAAAGAALLVSCGGSDSAPPLSEQQSSVTQGLVIVMGASLSDVGNACPSAATPGCPPVPPYAAGRFSNGPLFVETVAAAYGATLLPSAQSGLDFSVAGARTGNIRSALDSAGLQAVAYTNVATPSMAQQVDSALARFNYQLSAQMLVIIDATAVGNNIADALTLAAANPAQAAQIPTAVLTGAVTDIVSILNRVYAAGSRRILIVNSPNIGRTPRVQALGDAAIAGATAMSVGFNTNLAAQVSGLQQALTGANIVLFDLFALEAQIVAGTAPGGFALANVTASCVVTSPPSVCTTPDQYFYWDSFHPTAALGAYVAARIALVLPAP